ncbi:MAG: hypothetical protein ACE5GF_07175 [Thermodesulfobacteriota bacterium]
MSFYTKIKTSMANKQYIISALAELEKRGEIVSFQANETKEEIEIDRDGDILNVVQEKSGSDYEVAGDARVAKTFADRLKQMYAYESIKDNIPLDFEIAEEAERAGEISILLKG